MQIHYPIVDGHGDIPTDVFLRRSEGAHKVLDTCYGEKLKMAGIHLQVMAIYVEEQYKPYRSLEIAMRMLESLLEDLEESDQFLLIQTQSDLAAMQEQGKIGVLLDLEGCEPAEGGLELLHLLFRLGIRMVGLTWNQRNRLADGIAERECRGGLTAYGRAFLAEADALGLMVDVSHLSPAGVDDVLRLSGGHVLASHAAAAAVYDHPRNLSDAHIRGIADRGGMIGVPAFPYLLGASPSVETAVDHVVHLLETAGEDHVGIGADFVDIFAEMIQRGRMGKEWIVPPGDETDGLRGAADLPNLIAAMERRGFPAPVVRKVAGENYLRFFRSALPN